jgi:hypothetical protein
MKKLLGIFLTFLTGFAWAATPTPTAQWDVNEQGRTGDSCFYEQINGTLETCSGTTAVDSAGAIDGIDFTGAGYVLTNWGASGLSSTDTDSNFTIAIRLKQDTPVPATNVEWWAGYHDASSGNPGVRVGVNTTDDEDTKASWTDGTNSNFLNPSPDALQDGSESVVVFRRVGTELSLWKDGTEVVVNTYTLGNIVHEAFEIGAQNTTNSATWHFNGTMYWVAVWTTDLTDAQIGELDDTTNPFASTGLTTDATKCVFASGDEISVTANASTTSGDCDTAKSMFLSGGDLSNTRIGVLTDAYLANATETTTADNLTINSPDNGTTEHFNTSDCANPGCDDDSLYENADFLTEYSAFASGDDVWVTVSTGACDFEATTGVFSCTTLPATGTVRVYDVTATDWLTESSWTIEAPSSGLYLTPLNSPIRSPIRSPLRAPIQ